MSRDVFYTAVGRDFKPSPNRDRLTRKTASVTDWYVNYQYGNQAAVFDASVIDPAPPAGFVFEDFRSPPSLHLTSVLSGDAGVYAYETVAPGRSGVQVTLSGGNATGYWTRGLSGVPSGWYRLRLRVWGLIPLANFYGNGPGYVTRLGTVLPPTIPDYPPPDLTVYQKNPMLVFEWTSLGLGGPSLVTTPDFAQFGGIPLNGTELLTGSGSDSPELYRIDRVITAAVQLATLNGAPSGQFTSSEYANIKEHRPFTALERTGNVIETINRNAAGQPTGSKLRFLHVYPFRPNGDLLNPPNPVTVPGSSLGANLMLLGQAPAFYYRHAALGVHVLPLVPISGHEAPTLQVLVEERQ